MERKPKVVIVGGGFGGVSSSLMVRTNEVVAPSCAPSIGADSVMITVSGDSSDLSLTIDSVIVFVVSPSSKTSVPSSSPRSEGMVAVPPVIAKSTAIAPSLPFVRCTVRIAEPAFSDTVAVDAANCTWPRGANASPMTGPPEFAI